MVLIPVVFEYRTLEIFSNTRLRHFVESTFQSLLGYSRQMVYIGK